MRGGGVNITIFRYCQFLSIFLQVQHASSSGRIYDGEAISQFRPDQVSMLREPFSEKISFNAVMVKSTKYKYSTMPTRATIS